MRLKKLFRRLKPPCARCPYKLGLVRAVVNPCPRCRENGYSMFEQFRRRGDAVFIAGPGLNAVPVPRYLSILRKEGVFYGNSDNLRPVGCREK